MEAQKALSSSELPSVSTGQKTAISPDFVDMTHLYKETTALFFASTYASYCNYIL